MLGLQGDFSVTDVPTTVDEQYQGLVHFSQYEVTQGSGDPPSFALVASSSASQPFEQPSTSPRYHTKIPTSSIFGPNYGEDIARYLAFLNSGDSRPKLADLTISFSVGLEAGFRPQHFDALFYVATPRLISEAHDLTDFPDDVNAPSAASSIVLSRPKLVTPTTSDENGPATSSGQSASNAFNDLNPSLQAVALRGPEITEALISGPIVETSDQLNARLDQTLFCVNKKTALVYLDSQFPDALESQKCVVLFLIAVLVDLSDLTPKLRVLSDGTRLQFDTVLRRRFNLSPSDQAYNAFTKVFHSFFEFPLQMSKEEPMKIAGTVQILPKAGASVFRQTFEYYHLSLSYLLKDAADSDHLNVQISQIAWDKDATVADNTIKFSYGDPHYPATISGPVTVVMTDYTNNEVYKKSFDDTRDPELQNLKIVVDLRAPPTVKGGTNQDGSIASSGKRLRGQIVSLVKNCTLKGTVLVQAKANFPDAWRTVSTATSDKDGNFTMPYPYGQYVAAQALTSLDPTSTTIIPISADAGNKNESISSQFRYILLQKPSDSTPKDEEKKDSCGCTSNTTAGRLPSHDDLIQSDQYTQDMGGGCINLTVPNRTLREFSYTAIVRNTDPDVANYTLSSSKSVDPVSKLETISYELTANGKIFRNFIDINNPIKWQDLPEPDGGETLYEAVTVSTGHVLYYRSEFRADGYSLGNLLYSLPLAPGQKREIVILDSSHSFQGSESQSLSQTERLAADLLSERDVVDQIGGQLGEQLMGSSEATTAGVSATAGAQGGAGTWSANVGVSGGFAKSSSSASQDSGRQMSGHFEEMLRQGVHQSASSYRQQNSSIVTTTREAQHYQAETTVMANHNHCHSITMMHYEVLRHFAVYQELVNVEECVFIPFPLTKFTIDNVSKWKDALVTKLLPINSNTYMNSATFYGSGPRHPLVPAFDALERVRTQWALVDWPLGRYDEELIAVVNGEMTINVNLPRPVTRYDMIRSFPIITQQNPADVSSGILGFLTGGISLLVTGSGGSESQVRQDISDKFMRLDANFQGRRPADCMRLVNLDPISAQNSSGFDPLDFFHDSKIDLQMWQAYADVLGNGNDGIRKMMKYYFLNATISEWDGIWKNQVVHDVYRKLTDNLFITKLSNLDFTQIGTYRGGYQSMRIAVTARGGIPRKQIDFITVGCRTPGAAALGKTDVQFTLGSLRLAYSTAHFNGLLYNGTANNDILDGASVYCPESAAEQRFPRLDDQWIAQRLITHLNHNLEYYNRVLLYSLDAQRRFMLLDGFKIETFNRDGTSAGPRSLSSVVKNSPVGMAGNSIVFPVAPGYKVDLSLILQDASADGDGPSRTPTLLDLYLPEVPSPPYRISVPSKGVYSESVMGQCDSCEKLKPDSSQDWTKFTTDEPTAINAVTPIVPQVTDYNPTTKDFAQPIISIQNAPTNPDPGAGLSGLTQLLGKSGIFKDVTGLDANQQNAIKTYLSNNDNARAAAGMASTMASQQHNTSNSAQIMGTIQQAQDSGILTKPEAGQLVKQHIQNQIDGGTSQKAALEQQKSAGKKSLSEAAVTAAMGNKNVEATTVDDDGNVSTVKISSTDKGKSVGAKVQPPVPILTQEPGKPTCWAVAAAMLESWKAGKALAVEDALKPAGDIYVKLFQSGLGMPASQKDDFVKGMGMVSEPPASYLPSQYIAWMNSYGPLWITTDAALGSSFSPHAKILIQIDGDGNEDGSGTTFTWINPQDGSTPSQKFTDFLAGYEQMVTDNPGALFSQIVHFKDKISSKATQSSDGTEGFGLEGPWNVKTAVHENITLSALIGSEFNLDPKTTLDTATPEVREFIRGVMWNDDPECLFFDEREEDNWNFSSGLEWWISFNGDPQSPTNITARSHYGALQFLHAMASTVGEEPQQTLAKIMLWLEVMYKLSIEQGITGATTIESVPVVSEAIGRPDSYKLTSVFTQSTYPKQTDTLFTLLTANTEYKHVNLSRRAIGSCFHILQDSYAKGHVRREFLNPEDRVPNSQTEFQPGKFAKLGAVVTFHAYTKKQSHDNSTYDQWNDDKWPPMDPAKPDSLDPLWGARAARDKSVLLANFWDNKTKWEDGVSQFFNDVVFPSASEGRTNADDTV